MVIALIKPIHGNSDPVLWEACWLPNTSHISKLTSDKIKKSILMGRGESQQFIQTPKRKQNMRESGNRLRHISRNQHTLLKLPFKRKLPAFSELHFEPVLGFFCSISFAKEKIQLFSKITDELAVVQSHTFS